MERCQVHTYNGINKTKLVLQTQNDFLRDWIPHRPHYLFEMLRMEAPPHGRKCQSCMVNDGLIRCLDCFGHPMFCGTCTLNSHKRLPFHKIEAWNGKCFLPSTLHALGLVIHLGHGGNECPSYGGEWEDILPSMTSQNVPEMPDIDLLGSTPEEDHFKQDILILVDVSGVHRHNIRWCCCPEAPAHDMQLFHMHLFPASKSRPGTAFTFNVLDNFYIDSVECKTAANSFFHKLKRLTNNPFPGTVPVCL